MTTPTASSLKTILITGASTGFGRATAELLARDGHRVFASMRDTAGRNQKHADELRVQDIDVVELDVTDTSSVERAVHEVVTKAGRLDVVVNNAGLASMGVSEAFTPEQVQQLFDVNVVGIQRLFRAALPTLRKQGHGLLVNVGSILGRVTFPFFGLYGASKHAVEALTDSYRYELSQLGIDVVLVQPSAYPTPMYSNAQLPKDIEIGAEYKEIGTIPGKMFETFVGIFEGKDAPNPSDVPHAIAKLVSQPKGSRPARVVVGVPYGSDEVNRLVEPVQTGILNGLGLGQLAKLK